jgi:two-component sensor histidine kinase
MESILLGLLPRRRFPILFRYGVSALIVGAAALLHAAIGRPLEGYPLLLFVPAVFLCAVLFDKGSGFFATIFSAVVAAYYFIPPRSSFDIGWGQAAPLGIFIAVGFLIAAITEALREAVRRLEAAERSKALLLNELSHRTKNDLAIISSALWLQARASRDPAVQAALEEAIARVGVVAAAQERLRGDEDGGRIELAPYLTDLCAGLGDLLRDVRPIAVRVRSDPLNLHSSQAVNVGLIVNELVTNAFKHAFPELRGGAVNVDVSRDGPEWLRIVVADDGVGCDPDKPSGMGSQIVSLLAQQYGGTVEREDAHPGCRTVVALKIDRRPEHE